MLYLFISLTGLMLLSAAAAQHKSFRPVLTVFYGLCCTIYLFFRITTIPNGAFSAFLLGLLLFLSEVLGVWRFLFLQFLFAKEHIIEKKTLADFPDGPPEIDIFICTYNEPAALLEKTVIGALNMEYPPGKMQIHVLDDGSRAEIAALCKACGVSHITRPEHTHAKAGNLNHGLFLTSAPLFAVLDADMVPTKDFLIQTVGYFSDHAVAFVQTPQVFYNRDMYQRNLQKEDIPNEQDFFMRDIESARDTHGAVLHVGTNAVFRRSHMKAIGYYPTGSITEDLAAGLTLQAQGYRTLFINEALVFGLSASTYTDLAIQRDRWCRGNIQAIRKFRPLRNSRLTWMQKLCYLDSTLYWFSCFQKLVYMACPLFFLFTGQKTINAPPLLLLQFFLPYFLGLILSYRASVPDTRTLKWAHIYDIAMAPHMCISILQELIRPGAKFHVTPKEERNDKNHFQLHIILPHLIFTGISLIAFFAGLLRLHTQPGLPLDSFFINTAWAFYNLLGAFICIRVAYHIASQKHYREAEIPGGKDALFTWDNHTVPGTVHFLWEQGLAAKIEDTPLPNPDTPVSVKLSYQNQTASLSTHVEKISSHTCYLCYDGLTIAQKRVVLGIYMEHLRPVYDVKRRQAYR